MMPMEWNGWTTGTLLYMFHREALLRVFCIDRASSVSVWRVQWSKLGFSTWYILQRCVLKSSVETRLQCLYHVSVDFHTPLDHLWFSPNGMLLKEDDSCHLYSFLLHTLSSARTPCHGGSSMQNLFMMTGAELLTCGVIFRGSKAWNFTPCWFQHAKFEQKGECFRTYFTWKPGAF